MKLAKRIFAILLLVTLCLSMVACAEIDVLGVTTPTTSLLHSNGSTSSDTKSSVDYRNDYFKYTCEVPDGWNVLNEDELAQLVNVTNDALGDSKTSELIRESLESGVNILDFYASSSDNTQTINIVLSKSMGLDILLSERILLNASTTLLVDSLENMGATNISHNTSSVEFLGKKHMVLNVQGDFLGKTIYSSVFFLRKGLYRSTFTVSSPDLDACIDLLRFFHPID
jgi:hypothetical protein